MGKKIADALKQQEVNEDKFDTLDVNTESVDDTINYQKSIFDIHPAFRKKFTNS